MTATVASLLDRCRPATIGDEYGHLHASEAAGVAPAERTIHHGRRLSAARAYLHPARRRPNLVVRTGVQVGRVLVDGSRAVGVAYRHGLGAEERVLGGETVLCGGAINTPQVLELSGIGPKAVLERAGVAVIADMAAVGEHLQDHLAVHLQHRCAQPVSRSADSRVTRLIR